MAAAAVTAP